jgi:endonuclease/exonuclease/phosphatase family metal-dependent hydrolase
VRGPLVVTGDFNEEPAGAAYELMLRSGYADAWRLCAACAQDAAAGLTYPADRPKKRIDYAFHRGLGGEVSATASVPDTLASDHRPLVVNLWF